MPTASRHAASGMKGTPLLSRSALVPFTVGSRLHRLAGRRRLGDPVVQSEVDVHADDGGDRDPARRIRGTHTVTQGIRADPSPAEHHRREQWPTTGTRPACSAATTTDQTPS